jgi:hypothetical protein
MKAKSLEHKRYGTGLAAHALDMYRFLVELAGNTEVPRDVSSRAGFLAAQVRMHTDAAPPPTIDSIDDIAAGPGVTVVAGHAGVSGHETDRWE